jgi:hypothetical protein
MIGFISTLVTISLNHSYIQRYRWFIDITVPRCTRTRIRSSLVVSWQRISIQKPAFQIVMKSSRYFFNHSGTSELKVLLDSLFQFTTDSLLLLNYSVTTFTYLHRTQGKHRLYCFWLFCLRGGVFTLPLLRNGFHNPVVPQMLGADDIENTASPTVARWTVFTELLPGNALIKSVTRFRLL